MAEYSERELDEICDKICELLDKSNELIKYLDDITPDCDLLYEGRDEISKMIDVLSCIEEARNMFEEAEEELRVLYPYEDPMDDLWKPGQ